MAVSVVFRQTNHEGVLIDWVQEARERPRPWLINPGRLWSHLDRSAGCAQDPDIPVIECHLSNPAAREVSAATPSFRWRDRDRLRLRRGEL
jgi:3-dehydroquinate dehydratase-2